MKKFFLQFSFILVLSIAVGLVYNHAHQSPLPLFKPFKTDQNKPAASEDLSANYKVMDAETLKSLLDTGDNDSMVVLLDARASEKYKESHLPKAISLPIEDFESRYPEVASQLTKDKSIVIYCIGHDCLDSSLLAKELVNKGFTDIYVYKGGLEEWTALGNQVITPEGGSK